MATEEETAEVMLVALDGVALELGVEEAMLLELALALLVVTG